MDEKVVYVVTADGYNEGYGSELYLIGVFDSEEEAIIAKCNLPFDVRGRMTSITLNKTNDLKKYEHDPFDREHSYHNELYLGGYIE